MLRGIPANPFVGILAVESELGPITRGVASIVLGQVDQLLAKIVGLEHDAGQLRAGLDIGKFWRYLGIHSHQRRNAFDWNDDFLGGFENAIDGTLGDLAKVLVELN